MALSDAALARSGLVLSLLPPAGSGGGGLTLDQIFREIGIGAKQSLGHTLTALVKSGRVRYIEREFIPGTNRRLPGGIRFYYRA